MQRQLIVHNQGFNPFSIISQDHYLLTSRTCSSTRDAKYRCHSLATSTGSRSELSVCISDMTPEVKSLSSRRSLAPPWKLSSTSGRGKRTLQRRHKGIVGIQNYSHATFSPTCRGATFSTERDTSSPPLASVNVQRPINTA